MLSLRRPGAAEVARALDGQRRAGFSYPEVGATRTGAPAGYRCGRSSARVGTGEPAFERAAAGLRRWEAHRGAGIDVAPADAPLEEGTTVVLVAPVGPLFAVAACRVVYVVDEPSRFGFAYGTLPHHPERGEERFVVDLEGDGAVRFTIEVFSRHRHLLARLGGPVSRLAQRRATSAYLRGLRRYVERA